jgi:hypothetical protein
MPHLPHRLARRAADFAAKVRSEHLKGFSTRELLNFCAKALECRDAVQAARLTFLPLVENEDVRKGLEAGVEAHFGRRLILGHSQASRGPHPMATVEQNQTEPAKAPKAPPTGRAARQVTDATEMEAIWRAYKGNGGAMSYEAIERAFGLRPSNGMTAYRLIKKYAALKAKGGTTA